MNTEIIKEAFNRTEKYGLAGMLLLGFLFWARPHLDDLVTDHRAFLKATSETLSKQTETMAKQTDVISQNAGRLGAIESNTVESERMLRDIHGRILHAERQRDRDSLVDK